MITFEEILSRLNQFWRSCGCIVHQGYDLEVGAGTFNPATFLRSLGPEPYKAAYIEPCRRPADGRYGKNPNRLQHYFQYQVILKPSPEEMQQLYLDSLKAIGFDLSQHDIRFVHDDWESPSIGAWGLGWEVWMDGMEVTQYTYFQALGGIELYPVTGELTYGIERLATYLQKVDSIYDIQWNDQFSYRDLYHRNEVEWSHYNFEKANTEMWFRHFDDYEKESKNLMEQELPLPAYDFVMKASHAFNMLDARNAISVTERTGYIARIRNLAKKIAQSYIESREKLGFPLLAQEEIKEPRSIKIPEETISEGATEDLLLEVGSEELPASFVPIGLKSLQLSFEKFLQKEEISYGEIKIMGTPRRLTIYIKDLALGKAEEVIEKRGPAFSQAYAEDGTPTKAAEGFFRSLNLEIPSSTQAKTREIKGKKYLIAQHTLPHKSTLQTLAKHLPKLILQTNFPKVMHWGTGTIRYARPVRWVTALLGSQIIPFYIGSIESSRLSHGHRQINPRPFPIAHARHYVEELKKHNVMVDIEERTQSIQLQLRELEKQIGGRTVCEKEVLSQVLYLVEWPHVTHSKYDPQFLQVPREVLISEMVEHQKYFPVEDPVSKKLIPYFFITADQKPSDEIRHGNLKVLSARLADGAFLYEQDLKTPLEGFNEKLKSTTHQKILGTVFEKVERLSKHAHLLYEKVNIGNKSHLLRAAHLCKADLASEMVYEFPELQGTMGRYYAHHHNEPSAVALAIEEHWMPLGEKAPLPQTPEGKLLSLSDKIDELLGCFAIGLKPTSSSDPYALRRKMIGLIKILLSDSQSRFPLKEVLLQCCAHFPKGLIQHPKELVEEIWEFAKNRIPQLFLEYGVQKDEIEASLSLSNTSDDLHSLLNRIIALSQFRKTEAFQKLYEVYKRAKGQLQYEYSKEISRNLLEHPTELHLYQELSSLQPQIEEALQNQNFEYVYTLLAQLQPPLAKLFDDVKILDDRKEIQMNRLGIIHQISSIFEQILDFSKITEREKLLKTINLR